MIPILQFDPSSLSLWYDAHLIAKCKGGEQIGEAINLAYYGKIDELKVLVESINDPWVKVRAANMATGVWHEKRHFVDFSLTNYGALRTRQFFESYFNLPVLTQLAQTSGQILVPLDSNLCEVKREIYQIGDIDPRILELARGIASRKAMLEYDRRPFRYDGELIELGGEAILEAIAYHTQVGRCARVFGEEIAALVQQDYPSLELLRSRYSWAYDLLRRNGILNAERVGEAAVFIFDEPLMPFLYGALAGRFWKQPQSSDNSSHFPSTRLASLVIGMKEFEPRYSSMNSSDAWAVVNKLCAKIFGRTAQEEMDADIEMEAQFCVMARKNSGASSPLDAYDDYHRLRCDLMERFKRAPEDFLNSANWADRCVDSVRPKVVVAASAGEIGVPPDGYDRLFGYAEPNVDYVDFPEARWWWAAVKRDSPESSDIALSAHAAWRTVMSDYAPIAKLLTEGHRTRTMLGPEVLTARARFWTDYKIHFIVDGYFLYPPELHEMAHWYYMTGHEELRCELSFNTIHKPEGFVVDPWELRLRPKLFDKLCACVSDDAAMTLTLRRDWSPWVLSADYAQFFRSFDIDHRALASRFS